MRARVKTSIIINASPSAIFTYLANTKLHYVWNSHLREVKPLTRLHAGMRYETTNVLFKVRVRAMNIVSKFVEDREIEITNQTGTLDYRAHYRLHPKAADQTEVTCITVVESKGKAFYFARPMMEELARRELKADLAALKRAVEQQLT